MAEKLNDSDWEAIYGTIEPSQAPVPSLEAVSGSVNIPYPPKGVSALSKDQYQNKRSGRGSGAGPTIEQRAAQAIGVPADMVVNDSGLKFMQRLSLSFSDTDEEIISKFNSMYPSGYLMRVPVEGGGDIPGGRNKRPGKRKERSVLAYVADKSDPKEPWKLIDPSKPEIADIADIGGSMVTVVGGIAGSFIGSPVIGGAIGTTAGDLARQSLDALFWGHQKQSLGEVVSGAVGAGITDLAVGGGMKVIAHGSSRGLLKPGSAAARDLRDIRAAMNAGATDLAPLGAAEMSGHPALSSFAGQARASSMAVAETAGRQMESAVTQLSKWAPDWSDANAAQTTIQKHARVAYNRALRQMREDAGFVGVREGGQAVKDVTERWVKLSGEDVSKSYAELDAFAKNYNLQFDIGELQQSANIIRRGISATADNGKESINVSGSPSGELQKVVDEIIAADKTQADYEVIKAWRTRLGDAFENAPSDDTFNHLQARRLYHSLSRVLDTPEGVPQAIAQQFTDLAHTASGKAAARFDVLGLKKIGNIISRDPEDVISLGKSLGEIGGVGGLTGDVISFLRKEAGLDLETIRRAGRGNLLFSETLSGSGGSPISIVQKLHNFEISDRKQYEFLFPSKQDKVFAQRIAERLDSLNSIQFKIEVANATHAAGAFERMFMQPGTTRAQMRDQLELLSNDPDLRNSARLSAYDYLARQTFSDTERTLNRGNLVKVMDEWKRNGVWDEILNETDKIKIQGLNAYLRRSGGKKGDVGVSLENNQIITDLKHPTTFLNGVHKLAFNRYMGKFLYSSAGTRLLVGSGEVVNKFNTDSLFRTYLFLSGIAEPINGAETEQ